MFTFLGPRNKEASFFRKNKETEHRLRPIGYGQEKFFWQGKDPRKEKKKVLDGMDPRTSDRLDEELEKTFYRRRQDAWMVNEEDKQSWLCVGVVRDTLTEPHSSSRHPPSASAKLVTPLR